MQERFCVEFKKKYFDITMLKNESRKKLKSEPNKNLKHKNTKKLKKGCRRRRHYLLNCRC